MSDAHDTPDITLHHLEHSRSQRVLWLLEELALPYTLKRYARTRAGLAPPELTAVHPLGKSPVLEHRGQVVAETGAIVEYLLDLVPGTVLRPPPGTPDALRHRYWLHFAEGSAMPPLLMRLVMNRIRSARMPFFVKPVARRIADGVDGGFVTPNLERQYGYLEAELTQRPWFAGAEFSAADIVMSFPVEAAAARGGLDARYPRLQAWLQRIHARPAYQRALQAGGPYDLMR